MGIGMSMTQFNEVMWFGGMWQQCRVVNANHERKGRTYYTIDRTYTPSMNRLEINFFLPTGVCLFFNSLLKENRRKNGVTGNKIQVVGK